MLRFPLKVLRSATDAHALREAVIERLSSQRALLDEAASNSELGRYVGGLSAALGASASAAAAGDAGTALDAVELASHNAVETLRDAPAAVRAGKPAQALLRRTFSGLIAQRVLTQRVAELAERPGAPSELIGPVDLAPLLEDVVEDARAFCREKHGDSPQVTLLGAAAAPVLLPHFVAFGAFELLKNAMGAHIRSVGAEMLEELPPLELECGEHAGWGYVSVRDHGSGLQCADEASRCVRFLHTTNRPREANYTYSRNFGLPFEGLGVGLPLTALHAEFLGGALSFGSMPAAGVHVSMSFDTVGERSDPLLDAGALDADPDDWR